MHRISTFALLPLGDEAASGLAIDSLAKSLGIQWAAARSLFDRGVHDAASVRRLSDAELLRVRRIGPKTLARIRLATPNG